MTIEPRTLEADFTEAWPPAEWRDVHVLVAVSGGPDSVALLRAAVAIKARAGGRGQLHVGHLNHGLRREESAADAKWVTELCCQLSLPLRVGSCDVAARADIDGNGLEAAARLARYEFLRDVAEEVGARYVALGHTADDQVETVLHRLVRGTGLAGLAGMPSSRPLAASVAVVRPLLGVRRQAVLEYLAAIGQDFRQDLTNDDTRFTRNRLRHVLLPLLRSEFNSDVDQAVLRLAHQVAETHQVIAARADELCRRCMTVSPDSIQIDCWPLAAEPALMVREACKIAWTAVGWPLQEMGFDQWQQLAAMIHQELNSGSMTLPGNIQAERQGEMLRLSGPSRSS